MERNKERRPKNEAHRSSSAPPVYLVSGWLRVTGAQVSDGAASLRPPPPTHTQIRHVSFVRNSAFSHSLGRADSVAVPQLEHVSCSCSTLSRHEPVS